MVSSNLHATSKFEKYRCNVGRRNTGKKLTKALHVEFVYINISMSYI